jgi:pimeloyl-ACP methyl ester carboxylesterase
MKKFPRKKKNNLLVPILIGAGTLAATSLAAAGTWIVYSNLVIPDRVPLPEAIEADRKVFPSPSAGLLSYYVDDSAAGTPLVLLHSVNAAASAYEMKPLFEAFRGKRPVYALDLPGYGFSERDRRRYTPRLFANAINDLIATQVGEPADVVALSLSSEFAARAALEYPHWVRSLVLISPTGLGASRRSPADGAENGSAEAQADGSRAYPLLSFKLWARPLFELIASRPSIRYFLSKSFVGTTPGPFVRYSYLSAHQPGAENVPFYFLSGRLFTPDARPRLYERVDAPGLVIYDYDAYSTFTDLPRLLESKPNWTAERIIPTRGLPHWEMTDETVTVMERFWRTRLPFAPARGTVDPSRDVPVS